MTFYLGKELKLYREKFNELRIHYLRETGKGSSSAVFRHIVDELYDALNNINGKKEVESK